MRSVLDQPKRDIQKESIAICNHAGLDLFVVISLVLFLDAWFYLDLGAHSQQTTLGLHFDYGLTFLQFRMRSRMRMLVPECSFPNAPKPWD